MIYEPEVKLANLVFAIYASIEGPACTMASAVAHGGVNFWSGSTRTWGLSNLEVIAIATVGVLVATQVVLYVLRQVQERKRLPPGPPSWPVLGNLLVMSSATPQQSLQKLAAKYGGIMYLRLGSVPCIVISTAAAVREVFHQSNDAILSDRGRSLFAELVSGNYKTVAHAPHGPYWRQLRRFMSSGLLSPKTHESYRRIREEELRNMMVILVEQSAKGETINLKSWLFEASNNIMTMMLVNKRYFGGGGGSEEEKEEIRQLFWTLLAVFMKPVIGDFVPSLSFLTKLQGLESLFKDEIDRSLRFISKMTELESHRERAKERALRGSDDDYMPDYVDRFSTEPLDNGKPISDRLLQLSLLEFFVAGTSTSTATVEWAMAELVAHPDQMKRARQELEAVVGRDRLMQEPDIPNLPFLQAIVKETFRLHPPGPLAIPRMSSQEAEACGYKIPANSEIILNLQAIHRDPAVYHENPEEFNPQRFVDRPEANHMSGFDSYELIPFGVGRRMCPGANLGNAMVHMILGNLILSCEWSFPEGQSVQTCRRDNLDEVFGLAATRKEPLRLLAKPSDHLRNVLLNA